MSAEILKSLRQIIQSGENRTVIITNAKKEGLVPDGTYQIVSGIEERKIPIGKVGGRVVEEYAYPSVVIKGSNGEEFRTNADSPLFD